MKVLPGSQLWQSTFMGFICYQDWDLNNGGIILFDDGTMWSYDCESPSGGDQEPLNFPDPGFCIHEWKPGTQIWERLVPDSWGQSVYGNPPSYPTWPSYLSYDPAYPYLYNSLTEGPLNAGRVGSDNSPGYMHLLDGDKIWFYDRWQEDGLGPLLIDREKRTWKRFLTSQASQDTWEEMSSNLVLWDEYMWFMADAGAGVGMRLLRADKNNPDDVVVMHTWSDGGSRWADQITSNLDLPDWLDSQYVRRGGCSIAIHDGYLYLTSGGPRPTGGGVSDSRTVDANDATAVNYDMNYSMMRRCRIGDYEWELLYYHHNQGWVGYGADGTFNYGTISWGTVGVETAPGEFNPERTSEPTGMGFVPATDRELVIRDGWLYWWDNGSYWSGAYGGHLMLCRIRMEDLVTGEPVRHNPQDPVFELVTGGRTPWEGNAGHLVRYGEWRFWRDGANPVLPWPHQALTFDDDGNIIYKAFMFPSYYSTGHLQSGDFDPPGYPVTGLIKLRPPNQAITNVTLTFTGTSLTGYSNVREVPSSTEDLEVILGG